MNSLGSLLSYFLLHNAKTGLDCGQASPVAVLFSYEVTLLLHVQECGLALSCWSNMKNIEYIVFVLKSIEYMSKKDEKNHHTFLFKFYTASQLFWNWCWTKMRQKCNNPGFLSLGLGADNRFHFGSSSQSTNQNDPVLWSSDNNNPIEIFSFSSPVFIKEQMSNV